MKYIFIFVFLLFPLILSSQTFDSHIQVFRDDTMSAPLCITVSDVDVLITLKDVEVFYSRVKWEYKNNYRMSDKDFTIYLYEDRLVIFSTVKKTFYFTK